MLFTLTIFTIFGIIFKTYDLERVHSIKVTANKIKEAATAQNEGFATAQYIAEELEWRLDV